MTFSPRGGTKRFSNPAPNRAHVEGPLVPVRNKPGLKGGAFSPDPLGSVRYTGILEEFHRKVVPMEYFPLHAFGTKETWTVFLRKVSVNTPIPEDWKHLPGAHILGGSPRRRLYAVTAKGVQPGDLNKKSHSSGLREVETRAITVQPYKKFKYLFLAR